MADTTEPTRQQVVIKWHGTEFSVNLADDDTVGSLKRKIEAETEVAPKRQKLLGLKAKTGGGLPADTVPVSELLLKPGMKVMMMGCAAVQQMSDHAS
jgi:Ubiquitin family